jgi:hypothetical protein
MRSPRDGSIKEMPSRTLRIAKWLLSPRRLIARLSELVEANNRLTAANNQLTATNNHLTYQRIRLSQRVAALVRQVNAAESRLPGGSIEVSEFKAAKAQQISSGARPHLVKSARRAKFLIMSNMRSGSTWLETMLGAMPDVFTDFEFKFATSYWPSAGHYVLSEQSPAVTDILEGMCSAAPVVGSKFVFDTELTRLDLVCLQEKLGLDVGIIHLTRSLRDVFLSRRRGFHHQLNVIKTAAVGEHIKRAIVNAKPPSDALPGGAHVVAKLDCFEELMGYIRNDASVMLLRAGGQPYLHVGYEEVGTKLGEIVHFIDSAASPTEIAEVLADPPVLKLPEVTPASLVANIAELEPLFEMAEAMRFSLL